MIASSPAAILDEAGVNVHPVAAPAPVYPLEKSLVARPVMFESNFARKMKSSVDGSKEVVSITKPGPTLTLVEPRFVEELGPEIKSESTTESALSEGENVPAVAHRTVTMTAELDAPEVEAGAKRQSPAVPE